MYYSPYRYLLCWNARHFPLKFQYSKVVQLYYYKSSKVVVFYDIAYHIFLSHVSNHATRTLCFLEIPFLRKLSITLLRSPQNCRL